MTLDDATKTLESYFRRVVEFDPRQNNYNTAPNGKLYRTYIGNSEKGEGCECVEWHRTQQAAIDEFSTLVPRYNESDVLYWRKRPEIEQAGKSRYRVRFRATFAGGEGDSGDPKYKLWRRLMSKALRFFKQ